MSDVQGLGAFVGRTHVLPLRVYYDDTDLSGVVYHANYLRFLERGRTEFFRSAGIWLARLDEGEPLAWAVRRVDITYHRPARIDDPIEVHTAFAAHSGARIVADQKVHSRTGLLAEAQVEACIITLSGKPRRIPADVWDKLKPYLDGTNA